MDNETEIIELKWTLERQIGWIESADVKLTVLVPVPMAMLGSVLVLVDDVNQMTLFPLTMFLLSILFLIGALIFSGLSVLPRIEGPKNSNVFFGKISQMDKKSYNCAVLSRRSPDYLKDLSDQVHINAEIATKKHFHIRMAIFSLFFSVLPWAATLYLS